MTIDGRCRVSSPVGGTLFQSSVALAFDIDNTITTTSPRSMQRLHDLEHDPRIQMYVNTARPQEYCDNPAHVSTRLVPASRHYCRSDLSVRKSKRDNMERISAREGILPRRKCSVLIDDLEENVSSAHSAGFSAVRVDPRHGVDACVLHAIDDIVDHCVSSDRSKDSHPPKLVSCLRDSHSEMR